MIHPNSKSHDHAATITFRVTELAFDMHILQLVILARPKKSSTSSDMMQDVDDCMIFAQRPLLYWNSSIIHWEPSSKFPTKIAFRQRGVCLSASSPERQQPNTKEIEHVQNDVTGW